MYRLIVFFVIMRNTAIINAIYQLLIAYNPNSLVKKDADSFNYLIGQLVRQYDIPKANRHISKEAHELWGRLTNDNITNYYYNRPVPCNNITTSITCNLYTGSCKTGVSRTLNNGDNFKFRQLFHEDHVVPVSLIVQELLSLSQPISVTAIENTLQKMHMCILLKEEDRSIGRTRGRTLDFTANEVNVYNKNAIYIMPL